MVDSTTYFRRSLAKAILVGICFLGTNWNLADAQTVIHVSLYTFGGDASLGSLNRLGSSVSAAGDLNGDGFADLFAGDGFVNSNGISSGLANVFSGLDGSVLYAFGGDRAFGRFGEAVSGVGDLNGDSVPDLIAGAPGNDINGNGSGSIFVFSGLDGSILHTFDGDNAGDQLGGSVSGTGDVNGDGVPDLIAGAFFDDNNGESSGSARVFSGSDGEILHTFNGDSAGDQFGTSVSGVADLNGDGMADLIVGAPREDNNGANSGQVRVFSGADGSVIHTFNGDSAGDNFGASVDGISDVNDDGVPDLIIGARNDDNNGSDSGRATVFSGADGSVLYALDGDGPGDNFGSSVGGAGDVNGDGVPDLIVGARNNGAGSGFARVFSGADAGVLYTFNGDNAGDSFGTSVSSAGDVNDDGLEDLIASGSGGGYARVFVSQNHDFDRDGDVDADDIDFYNGNLGQPASFNPELDLNGDETISLADHDLHVMTLVQTSNGETGAVIGDVDLDGQVNVLGDALALVTSLGNTGPLGYADGDLNADGVVNVLGDALRLVANLGLSNAQ